MDMDTPQKGSRQKHGSSEISADEKLAEKKSSIRALKRVLTAKAQVRRLQALTKAKRVGSRR